MPKTNFIQYTVVFLFVAISNMYSQNKQNIYTETVYQYGGYLKNSVHDNSIFPKDNNSFMLIAGKQTSGKHLWEQSLGFPRYGLGVHMFFSGAPDIFGNSLSVFTFLNIDVVKYKKAKMFFEFAPGINYSPTHYDSISNPRNDIVSTNINFFVNMRLAFEYRINRVSISFGGNFTHFSNGATNMPNKGLNMYGVNLGLKYNLFDFENVDFDTKPKPVPEKKNNFSLAVSTGFKERIIDNNYNDIKFPIYTVVADYTHLYSNICEMGLGLDVFYDGTFEYDSDYANKEKYEYLQYGLHLTHIFRFNKYSAILNLGTYLINRDIKGLLWSRLGLRYNVLSNLFLQVALKTQYGAKADFIEWTVGVNI